MERPDLYVVARFLDILYNSDAPMKRTNIQMRLGLNYPRFTEYLEWLVERRLVVLITEKDEEAEKYTLSPKGAESYHKLVDWIREMMQGIKI